MMTLLIGKLNEVGGGTPAQAIIGTLKSSKNTCGGESLKCTDMQEL